ncbi:3-oxoacyl-ACP reductase [Cellulomonas sp. APG4]|uniref:3-oxoacyl-ACP reductase n=1 Tax=Cellulomonas sp. APG4 TaxID=1538656 RepID=UPI001379D7CC|nr:3-oxoacyl-ACP reductase [Cellulomonas sp. APG4]NCT90305.1 3-oxoacyl-ACP reductase [Cellulomonas sp. APG4]
MSDSYVNLVNSGFTKTLAKRLGLPRPAHLRRHRQGEPLVPGPVLVVSDAASGDAADAVAQRLLDWDLDVRRHADPAERHGAVVVVLTEVSAPADLGAPMLEVGSVLRGLRPGGRVVIVSRAPEDAGSTATAAARQGIDGMMRSLAKELRGGATGNQVVLTGTTAPTAPSALGALRFLLSARSAFVDGQPLRVADGGAEPADWERPLAGQVAVVTGAARGIGAAIARTLARDGATLVVVDVPAAGDALAQVANEVRGSALQLDVTADDAADRLVEHVRSRHGRLDLLVHNAGILRDKLLANMKPATWDPVIAVNVTAPLTITEKVLAAGAFGDAPRVVCLASTSGIAGNRGQTNYGASKAGVIGMVRASAADLAAAGGTINAVAPGFIETDMTSRIPFATREVARRLNSLQQGGRPIDVAEAIAFLASPQAGGVNGQVLRVCGQNLVGA